MDYLFCRFVDSCALRAVTQPLPYTATFITVSLYTKIRNAMAFDSLSTCLEHPSQRRILTAYYIADCFCAYAEKVHVLYEVKFSMSFIGLRNTLVAFHDGSMSPSFSFHRSPLARIREREFAAHIRRTRLPDSVVERKECMNTVVFFTLQFLSLGRIGELLEYGDLEAIKSISLEISKKNGVRATVPPVLPLL